MKPIPALLPFSWLYGIGIGIRNFLFNVGVLRINHVGATVISVGNMTTGGTGKTPIVELIAQQLLEMQPHVAVLSRGYKRTSRGLVEVSDGSTIKTSVEEAGDEPFQIAQKLPGVAVVVDERRVRGAQFAIEKLGAEIILLDDGFQHRQLHHDSEIVVVDASQSPFDMAMLPAGKRREQLSSLKRANAVVITRADSEIVADNLRKKMRKYSNAEVFTCSFRTNAIRNAKDRAMIANEDVKGKRTLAFCGIGNPKGFWKSLEENGVNVAAIREFPDHHKYSRSDIVMLEEEMQQCGAEILLTTEKDAVRFSSNAAGLDKPLWYLEIKAKINEEEQWKSFIASVIKN
jgi:tetraacyldisaccharide 4'-kinase